MKANAVMKEKGKKENKGIKRTMALFTCKQKRP